MKGMLGVLEWLMVVRILDWWVRPSQNLPASVGMIFRIELFSSEDYGIARYLSFFLHTESASLNVFYLK